MLPEPDIDIITYAYYDSPVGILKIGGTDQYITEISFASSASEAVNTQSSSSPILHKCTEQLIEVWAKLSEITYGLTYSYTDLAKKLGDPKVIRASAEANGKNKLMILVPCHRVIGADRSLVGYAGGMPVKKWLLQHEFRIKHGVQTLF
jgi:methylated-DNA-[protein]-cysteine S-methyltransferase